MLFTSIIFLSVFLPIVFITYFLTPKKYKNITLFVCSLCFYIWGEKDLVFLLLFTIILNFISGIIISKGYRKTGLVLSLIFSLGSLFYFKYATFAYTNIVELLECLNISSNITHTIPQILLPLGISFYTFQVISYTIDVYRGHIKACTSFLNFSTYVLLFPHLIAGPIVRYANIEKQLIHKDISIQRIAEGIERFILGLAKKMFIANNCAIIADTIFNVSPEYSSPAVLWVAAIAYTFQIYFDFSAYSDMAIGLARVFGIDFHENFNYPYISSSIKEFWRRWHISLSSWFRDYVYIPLGGNRISNVRTYINLFVVFLATGLWHGASWNFIFWGLWHGSFLVFERIGFDKVLDKLYKPLRYVYTFIIVIIGWVFFRVEDFTTGIEVIKRMFLIDTQTINTVYYFDNFLTLKNCLLFLVATLLCFPIFLIIRKTIFIEQRNQLMIPIYYTLVIILLVGCISMLAIGTYNPFIYFRF